MDEPYLDVENPYEGLGPGRPDSIGRALLPTAGRQSPDSIGQGKTSCFWAPLLSYQCFVYVYPSMFFSLIYYFSPSRLW